MSAAEMRFAKSPPSQWSFYKIAWSCFTRHLHLPLLVHNGEMRNDIKCVMNDTDNSCDDACPWPPSLCYFGSPMWSFTYHIMTSDNVSIGLKWLVSTVIKSGWFQHLEVTVKMMLNRNYIQVGRKWWDPKWWEWWEWPYKNTVMTNGFDFPFIITVLLYGNSHHFGSHLFRPTWIFML